MVHPSDGLRSTAPQAGKRCLWLYTAKGRLLFLLASARIASELRRINRNPYQHPTLSMEFV